MSEFKIVLIKLAVKKHNLWFFQLETEKKSQARCHHDCVLMCIGILPSVVGLKHD